MTIAEGLKKERNKLNLSQKEFAEKLGINARTYASYERGERDISTSILLSICQTLGISSDELLGNSSADTDIDKPLASSDDELKFALFDGSEGVTDEMFEEVKQFAAMVKMREDAKKEKK